MPPQLYIQYGARAGLPPVIATNVQLFGFFLQADKTRLDALCKKVLQSPTIDSTTSIPAVTCSALDQYVLLMFATIQSIQDVVGGPSTSEKEALVFIPVEITAGANPKFPALFVPYIVLDNPATITAGRELWGYPKSYGKVTTDYSLVTPPAMNVQAFGRNAGDPTFGLCPFIDVAPLGFLPNPASWASLLQPLSTDFAALVTKLMSGLSVKEVFLKQFQDVDGVHSCLQQITVADYTITPNYAPIPLGFNFNVTIQNLQTHPIETDLGVASQVVEGGFFLPVDFVLAQPTIVWP